MNETSCDLKAPSRGALCKGAVAHSVEEWLGLTMPWIYNQLKYTRAFQPFVLTQSTLNLELFPWEPIYAIPQNRHSWLAFRALRKLGLKKYPFIYDEAIRRHKPLLLHSHFADRGWYDLPMAAKYGLKHVVTFYGYDVNMMPSQQPVWRKRYQELFARADLFLCEGPHMAAKVSELGCPQDKLRIHKLGIEVNKIPFVPRALGSDGVLKILIAGTFREKKGIPDALRAVALLRDAYPHLHVTIIGDSTGEERSNREKTKILDAIERYRLRPITHLLGYQPHDVLIEEAYKHHIFLSPSVTASDGDTEGGAPVSIIEALASGLIVVATLHCDIANIVEDGKSGFLVPERNPEAIAAAIRMLLADQKSWSSIAGAGRRNVEANHSCVTQAARLEKHYASVLNHDSHDSEHSAIELKEAEKCLR